MEITITPKAVVCNTGTTEQLVRDLDAARTSFLEGLDENRMKILYLSDDKTSIPIASWSDCGAGFPGGYTPTNWESTYKHYYSDQCVQAINDFASAWAVLENRRREEDEPLNILYAPSEQV